MESMSRKKSEGMTRRGISGRSGFTMLELAVSMGIVAILGTVSVMVLQPAQIYKQTKDSNRIADLENINKALVYYQAAGGSAFGSTNVIYTSIPSSFADCSDILLPTPPVGWTYACKPAASYRNIDGTGWIPVDFTAAQGTVGNLFSTLPIDPVNTALGDFYYTYIHGSWTMSATMESQKYLTSLAGSDNGCSDTRYEVGDDLALNCNITPGGGLSSSKDIASFTFANPSVNGVINEVANTIAITVPYGTNVTSLVPTLSISALASVSPLSGVARDFTNPVTYTVTAENGSTQVYTVTVTPAANPAKAITAFNFASPAATGSINEGAHTIALTVPYGTNVTALVPTITITGASVSPNTGVAQNFTNPVTYTVTAADSSTQNYSVTVTPAANPAKAITAFNFASPAATGVVTEANHTVAITVPNGTNVTALVPTITITGSSVSPNTGVAQNFTNPVTYTVTAADTTTQAYTVTVTIAAPACSHGSQTFSYTGAQQTLVVGVGCTTITVDARGAMGGGAGGAGGRTQGSITVTPGETLYIYVGGQNGYNGGGSGSVTGGGATDIRQGGTALANRVIVAAGGGGGGYDYDAVSDITGGAGGGTTGGTGGYGYYGGGISYGGTQSAGGTSTNVYQYNHGSPIDAGYGAGSPGALGQGGAAANAGYGPSGGGGGGYYGGAGGSADSAGPMAGSGGGGSALVPPGGTTTSAYNSGNGSVILTW